MILSSLRDFDIGCFSDGQDFWYAISPNFITFKVIVIAIRKNQHFSDAKSFWWFWNAKSKCYASMKISQNVCIPGWFYEEYSISFW